MWELVQQYAPLIASPAESFLRTVTLLDGVPSLPALLVALLGSAFAAGLADRATGG
jgi:hypothetical protein